jgi:putative flippase GtrA
VSFALAPGLSPRGRMVLAYCAFAALAMSVNLGAQWVVLHFARALPLLLRPLSITVAMGVGTGCGLVLKYLLDKRFIFQDPATGARAHARRFSLYAAGGLVTTAIPYGLELALGMLFPHGPAVLVGGGIGLVIGYTLKFRLDRRFVFNRP